jgi:hypothetical protein
MTKSKPKAKRMSTSESKPKPKPVTVARRKRAIEGRNARALAALYGEDAVVQVIDRDNPPSKPRNLEGRSAISAYFDDVCGRVHYRMFSCFPALLGETRGVSPAIRGPS